MSSIYSDRKRVEISGYVAQTPVSHEKGENYSAFTTISLACNDYYRKEGDEVKHTVEFYTIYFNNGLAEIASTLKQGDKILVDGKLRNRQWTDKEGQKHSVTEVVVYRDGLQIFSKTKSEAEESTENVIEQSA